MANSYKTLKEDFVSNLAGGSILEINKVTALAPVAIILWSTFQSRRSFFTPYTLIALVTDFLLNVGVILLATTLYSSSPTLLAILILSPAFLLYTLPSSTAGHKRAFKPPAAAKLPNGFSSSSSNDNLDPFPVRPFLTTYRGAMLVVTCLAILAVDFRVFPRRFAKVETWGTSLMDLGVGSFVFSAGVVSARPILKDKYSNRKTTLRSRLYASAKHSLPLLVLGLARLWSVKGLDYAEHVTEYGVHWNFFFTLAFIPPFVALFQSFFSVIPSYALLSLLLSGIYQIVLETTNLKAFILIAPRTDVFSQNREGIFSFVGYLSIFLAGQATGMYILPRDLSPTTPAQSVTGYQRRMTLLRRLAFWSLTWTILFLCTTNYRYGLGLQISRRLANLPYTLWVAAFNTCQITVFCTLESIFFPAVYKAIDKTTEKKESERATSRVLKAYNRNGLAIFLAANLLTGLVNLTLPTLSMDRLQSMGILSVYAVVLTGLAVGLDLSDISIKM
ncbi:MAG: Glucosaminyl phosphatidylinositol (GlcN-PI) nositol acylation protein [Pleopsidium flavum]|nr:MAG: Glucosaminyl phosphatidylinositol (GlcN-PI) nositol acylation protein [Pleopsidium flavum]